MENGQRLSDDRHLEQALETVRTSPSEAENFAADPEGYLKNRGVNTEGLKFGSRDAELSDRDLENVAGGKTAPAAGICAAVGTFGLCVSVGT
jgi:hypothetical protein